MENNLALYTSIKGTTDVKAYANIYSLPTSGMSAGDLAYITANDALYISEGSGWFKFVLINESPTVTVNLSSLTFTEKGNVQVVSYSYSDPEASPLTVTLSNTNIYDGNISHNTTSNLISVTSGNTTATANLTISVFDGINTNTDTITLIFSYEIENSNHTVLLAKASGNNGTNAITDESSNSYTITKAGNTTRSAFSPYRDAGYSYYFDGSGDYIAMPSNSTDVQFGSGDFTVEAWIYPTASGVGEIINKWQGTTSNSSWRFWISANNVLEFDYRSSNGSTYVNAIAAADNSIRVNEWQHVAATRNGSTWRLFNNGIKIAEATDSGTINNGSYPVWIGRLTDSYGNDTAFTGYISDARIIKGTAIYTADFTVPTERLTAVSGTSLLTCHLPYLADGSSSDYSLTANGNVKAEAFTPFDNSATYSASNNGSSFYLDGSGDYLTIADTAARLGGSGGDSWTIECWVYLEGLPSSRSQHAPLWVQYAFGQGNRSQLYINQQENKLLFWVAADGTTQHETALTTGQWYHIAMVKSGNSVTLYLNGKGETDSIVYDAGLYQENPTIGAVTENGDYMHGYIADYVMTKGTAKYSSDFTPPTAPISNSSATLAIANVSTPNLYAANQNRNAHILYGSVKSSTGQTKYASSSIYFDGSGDYILNNTSVDTLTTTTQPFTIEAWIYPTWNTSTPMIVCFNRASDGYNTMLLNQNYLYIGDTQYDYSTTPSLNEWSHIAVTHNSGRWNAYLNGNNVTSPSKTLAAAPSANYVGIGVDFDAANGGSPGNYFQGYMQDVRISDIIRYPFIPAKETFSAVSGTTLLTAHASSVTDGSSSGHTVTAAGNAAVSTFAPSSGMYSVSLDGSGDYLSVPTSTDFSFDGDFTLEGWFYFNALTGNHILFDTYNSGTSGTYQLYYRSTGTSLAWYDTSSASVLLQDSRSGWMVTDKWYHIAVVRESGALTIFVDGSQVATTTGYTTNLSHSRPFVLGAQYSTSTNYVNGYISNVRVTKGSALYSKNFTPPTAELRG